MRKKEILPFVTTWIDLGDPVLSKPSQTKEDKCCMIWESRSGKRNS